MELFKRKDEKSNIEVNKPKIIDIKRNNNSLKTDSNEFSIKIVFPVNQNEDHIRILKDNFVNNNKNRCKMEINGKIFDLINIIYFKDYGIKSSDKNFEIILKDIPNSIQLNEIFSDFPSNISKIKLSKPFTILTKENLKNEIILTVKIENDDIDKNIYILDNFSTHDHLTELNEKNTELYINNKKEKFNKYFIAKQKGIYTIKLIFNLEFFDCSYMFAECLNLINIDLTSFNTQNVVNMEGMFFGCQNLTNINLSSLNTENVTNMKGMFYCCRNLTNIDLTSFNTKKVKNISCMFDDCYNLKKIDLSFFNTQNVIDMKRMFAHCENLVNIDLSSFDTFNVISMRRMFGWCKKLENIDLSSIILNISDLAYIFGGCINLKKLKINRKSYNKFKKETCDSIFIIEI